MEKRGRRTKFVLRGERKNDGLCYLAKMRWLGGQLDKNDITQKSLRGVKRNLGGRNNWSCNCKVRSPGSEGGSGCPFKSREKDNLKKGVKGEWGLIESFPRKEKRGGGIDCLPDLLKPPTPVSWLGEERKN